MIDYIVYHNIRGNPWNWMPSTKIRTKEVIREKKIPRSLESNIMNVGKLDILKEIIDDNKCINIYKI